MCFHDHWQRFLSIFAANNLMILLYHQFITQMEKWTREIFLRSFEFTTLYLKAFYINLHGAANSKD